MNPKLQLFTAQNGEPSARVIRSNGQVLHLHSAVNPRTERSVFESLDLWGDTIVLLGCGLGYHLYNAFGHAVDAGHVIAVDFFSEMVHALKIGKCAAGIDIISSQSSRDERRAIALALSKRPGSVQIIRHPPSYAVDPAWYDGVLADLELSSTGSIPTINAIKKALVFVGNFFCEKECVSALHALGIEPVVFRYNDQHFGFEYESHLQRCIEQDRPDFILSINMKGFDCHGVLRRVVQRKGLPLAVWFVDDPHPIIVGQEQNVWSQCAAFCWERSYLDYLKQAGFGIVQWLPLASDPAIFNNNAARTQDIRLSFVGTPSLTHAVRRRFLWSPALEPVIMACAQLLLCNAVLPPAEILKTVLRNQKVKLPFTDAKNITWLIACFIHQATAYRRQSVLQHLLTFDIEFFGDPAGWRQLFGNAIAVHPDLDYWHDLAAVYGRSAITINSTSCQMASAVNQRVFDAPLCGSFVLSDKQADMSRLFDLSTEAICYESADDLKEKIRYYSENDSPRHAVIEAAQKRILGEHTYLHRIALLLKSLQR